MEKIANVLQPISKLPGIKGHFLYWNKKMVVSETKAQFEIPKDLSKAVEYIEQNYNMLKISHYQSQDMLLEYDNGKLVVQPFTNGYLMVFTEKNFNYAIFTLLAKTILQKIEADQTVLENAIASFCEDTVQIVSDPLLNTICEALKKIIGEKAEVVFKQHCPSFAPGEFPRHALKTFLGNLIDHIPQESDKKRFLKEIAFCYSDSEETRSSKTAEIKAAITKKRDNLKTMRKDRFSGLELGECILEKFIAGGSAGKIYLGKHINLGIDVAVKILSTGYMDDLASIERFMREGKILAQVEHPNVVKVINLGNAKGYNFIVMRYIDGKNLREILRSQGTIEPLLAVEIAIQIAQGLQSIHSMGVVHRDIKPSNVVIEFKSATTKIVDFGTVYHLHQQRLTPQGVILGTPLYMSPEQCLSKELDNRSDIYSLGATLYHLLTGFPPFQMSTNTETMMAHLEQELIPPYHRDASLPKDVSHVVCKMMKKKRENRYQNMQEVILALNESIRDLSRT